MVFGMFARRSFGPAGLGLLGLLLLPACSDDGALQGEPIGSSGAENDTEEGDSADPSNASDTAGESDPTADPGTGADTSDDSEGTGGGECGGCIDEAGACVDGQENDACGVLGAACVACEGTTVCAEGECLEPPACGPDNCDGCCDGDTCVEDTSADACGSGGAQCTPCPSGSSCDAGVCDLPCSLTCEGCCTEDDECIETADQSAQACGAGADTCMACDGGLDCVGGECISNVCAESCDGCCDGDTCLDGDTAKACGSDGSSCQPCIAGTSCEAAGCIPEADALWDIVVYDGQVAVVDLDGDPWDAFGGVPDPYVTIEAAGASGESEVQSDTFFPEWNEVVVEGVSTAQLMGPVEIAVVDSDIGFDTTMATCETSFADEDFGATFTAECSLDDYVAWTLLLSIQPSK